MKTIKNILFILMWLITCYFMFTGDFQAATFYLIIWLVMRQERINEDK